MGWTYVHRPLEAKRSAPDDNIFDFLGFNSMWAEDGPADADIRAVRMVTINWLRTEKIQFHSLADVQNHLAQQVRRQLRINRLRLLLPWQWLRLYKEVWEGGRGESNKILVLLDEIPRKKRLLRYFFYRPLAFLEHRGLWRRTVSKSRDQKLQQFIHGAIITKIGRGPIDKNLRRDMRRAYDRARMHSPWPSAFDSRKIKILVHIRQGDVGIIRAPWGKSIFVASMPPRVVNWADEVKLSHNRLTLWPSKVLFFLRELVARLEREQLSIITSSDGYRRTFARVYAHRRLLHMSEAQLKALENMESTYDEEQFSGFSEISSTYIGENSENLRHLVDGLMRSDIVITGTAGSLPRALLSLYRAQSTPLPLLVLLLRPREYSHVSHVSEGGDYSPTLNRLCINIEEPDFELAAARIKEHMALVR